MNTAAWQSPSAADLFGPLSHVDDQTSERLHARLAAAAAESGVLDVAYRILDSPLGSLLVAATEAGLVRVAFAGQDHAAVLAALADRVSPRVLRAPERLDDVARELDEYFQGSRTAFDLALDMRLAHGFRRQVLAHLQEIRYGSTQSYGIVAAATGHPRAARAVGSACRFNPLPIVVPCHRVVRSDGSAGDYAGGAAAKRQLLALESSLA